jgi:hypothetical protein
MTADDVHQSGSCVNVLSSQTDKHKTIRNGRDDLPPNSLTRCLIKGTLLFFSYTKQHVIANVNLTCV